MLKNFVLIKPWNRKTVKVHFEFVSKNLQKDFAEFEKKKKEIQKQLKQGASKTRGFRL